MRFSLRKLGLTITCIALAITVVLLSLQIAPLRAEVRRLRAETGKLSIDNVNACYGVYVPPYDDLTWRWKVWLAEGKKYRVGVLCNKVPFTGLPSASADVTWFGEELSIDGRAGIPPGEYVVTIAVRKSDGEAAKLKYELRFTSGEARFCNASRALPLNGGAWPLNGSGGISMGDPSPSIQIESNPGEPLVLMRYRTSAGSLQFNGGPPADGMMVWVEALGEGSTQNDSGITK